MTVNDSYRMVNAEIRPISIGVLLDRRIQERWVLDSLRQCLAVPGARLAGAALLAVKHRDSFVERLQALFDKLDQRMRCRGERLFAATDVAAELALSPLQVDVVSQGDRWRPDEAGIATLQRCEVDLWLCFSAIPPSRLPRSISRLGTWGIEISEGVAATNVWAGAAELQTGSPVTMLSVVDYAAAADGLLYRSFGATVRNSPRLNRLSALHKGVSFFKRLLERLKLDPDNWPPLRPATLPAPAHYPRLPVPTVSALARLSWTMMAARQLLIESGPNSCIL